MNKKLIAVVSSIAFALAPATTVLAEGEDYNPSAENHSEVTTEENTSTSTEEYNPSAENHSEVDTYTYEPVYYGTEHAPSVSSNTDVKTANKHILGAYQYGINDFFVKSLIKQFKLDSKKIVDAFWIDEYNLGENEAYDITFTNKAIYKDGHVYKVHHFHFDNNKGDYVEKEAPTATAKDGSIKVTLHGASPVLIEDLGVAKTPETKVSKDGRKAALKTGVAY